MVLMVLTVLMVLMVPTVLMVLTVVVGKSNKICKKKKNMTK
jgi:hypothetical protein